MKIIFTKHAEERMIERKIRLDDIQKTIEMPDYNIRKDSKTEAYKKVDNKILKVVYSKDTKFIKIITLIWK